MSTEIRNDEVGIFLARELETILARSFEVEYADIKYSSLIPISTEVGPGADSYTYRVFDKQGSMKVIQDKAQDLPRADVLRKEVTHQVRSLGASFAYSIQETRAAALVPGMNLEQRRANAVRRAYEEKVQDVQDDIESRVRSLQTGSYARILKMARKPTKAQFRQTMIVCGIGMFILGLFGFVVQAMMNNVFPAFFDWLTGA